MNERLLQYIWAHSLFKGQDLKDVEGHPIQIIKPGKLNTHEGPDFTDARIRINNIELVGNIELHVMSSDWIAHQHQYHKAYDNIILHVVFIHDTQEYLGNFPTLEIGPHIPSSIIERYQHLIQTTQAIACAPNFHQVPKLTLEHWLSRMMIERWEQKTEQWHTLFQQTTFDWRSTLYIKLAENFGFKVNSSTMYQLAQSIPLSIIEKHQHSKLDIESLLFGQANLIPQNAEDTYTQSLSQQYQFLKHKYGLLPIHSTWKFLRMRPVNFPTIRIAQLASLLTQSFELFAQLLQLRDTKKAYELFDITASSYWDTHFHFHKESKQFQKKALGKSAIENILINTIAPFQYFYGTILGDEQYKEQAMELLSSIPAEKNHIIQTWEEMDIPFTSAQQSQAYLQLFKQYCEPKRCLHCAIGNYIIKSR